MKHIDMTKGHIAKSILLFSLPIFLGNLFQQLYSLSDTFVVGRYLGQDALAAMGASTAIMVLMNSIFIGLCMGSSVLFAKLYTAKEHQNLAKAIATSIIFIVGLACLVVLVSLLFLKPLLTIFQVPALAVPLAFEYLVIVLPGIIFLSLYNIAAAMLRAIGDSKTPLLFLIISAIINIAFDFILVIYIPMGVKGPALSTLLAQICSGVPIFIYTLYQFKFLKIKMQFDKPMFKEVWRYSVLTSLQQSIMNFGILLVQGLVNSFGVVAMAAFTIGVRIDAVAYMPAQDFGNAFGIFVAQNKGVKNDERIKKGFKSAIITSSMFCIFISMITYITAPFLIGLFSPENEQVILEGVRYLRIEGIFYSLIGYLFIFYALFRGLGMFKISIVLTITSLGTRVVLAYVFSATSLGLMGIWISIPIGWAVADILGFLLYDKAKRKRFEMHKMTIE